MLCRQQALRSLARILLALSALALVPAASAHGGASGEPRLEQGTLWRIALPLADPARQLPALRAMELDIHGFSSKEQEAYLLVDELELARLRLMGYQPAILEDMTPTDAGTDALSDYLDPVEVIAAIDDAAASYPAIAQRFDYPYLTAEGRTIAGIKISDNVAGDEAEPRIVFVSQHHAREVMTPEVLVDLIQRLTAGYGVDAELTRFVDDYQIYIVPNHNPDGTAYVFAGNTGWRKNRRNNGDGSFGVDNNRNYAYSWGPDGCNGSSGSPSSDTYRGPSAGSEPETRGLVDLVRAWHPSLSLTYHTYSELVLHPFGCSPALPDDPDLRAHREIGSMLAASIENDTGTGWYEMGTPYELLYEVDGDSDGWLHAVGGTVAFTIEMNASIQGFQPDYATWRDDTVARNREGLHWLLRRLGQGAVAGVARDACTGDPLAAEVGIVEQSSTHQQEPRTAVPGNGFFHRLLEPGEYTWFGTRGGYHEQRWPVTVARKPVTRDLWMVPLGQRGLDVATLSVEEIGGDLDGRLDPGEEAWLRPTAYATGEAVTAVTAVLASADPYVEILDADAAFADVGAGGQVAAGDAFRVRVLADAPDGHEVAFTVTFAAAETLCRASAAIALPVTRSLFAEAFVEETLDVDPGWMATGGPGGWEFGEPQGSGGTSGPDRGYTGETVYATNLDGNYGTTATEYVLTTLPFDLQGLRTGELRYRRWLNNETAYDIARIEASIDENEWIEVWRGFGRDTAWMDERLPLPEAVLGAPQVWFRFKLRQDGGGSGSGWYVDDVRIAGESTLTAGGRLKYEAHAIVESDPLYGNADGALDANETATLPVKIRSTRSVGATGVTAVLSTSAPGVEIRNGVAFYPSVPAGGVVESLAPHFTFAVGPDCGLTIPFDLEVRADDGSTSTSRFTVSVGTLAPATLLVDDMEIDRGWLAQSGGTDGNWERSDPRAAYSSGEMTNPEDDHTPAPGVAAWVTRNVPAPTQAPPDVAEVDGTQTLVSPALLAADFATLRMTYWRWFYTGGGPGPDRLRVEVSSDGGFEWVFVDEVGTKANVWTEDVSDLTAIVPFTDDFRVRFVATDGGGESIVEAGIDDVRIEGEAWFCDIVSLGDLEAPSPVGATLLVSRLGFDIRLDWTAPAEDPAHGPATLYRVTRSENPQGGFTEIGAPTAPLHVDLGAAGPSRPSLYTYLVTAENSGGTE